MEFEIVLKDRKYENHLFSHTISGVVDDTGYPTITFNNRYIMFDDEDESKQIINRNEITTYNGGFETKVIDFFIFKNIHDFIKGKEFGLVGDIKDKKEYVISVITEIQSHFIFEKVKFNLLNN